jgi:hypothetical protein
MRSWVVLSSTSWGRGRHVARGTELRKHGWVGGHVPRGDSGIAHPGTGAQDPRHPHVIRCRAAPRDTGTHSHAAQHATPSLAVWLLLRRRSTVYWTPLWLCPAADRRPACSAAITNTNAYRMPPLLSSRSRKFVAACDDIANVINEVYMLPLPSGHIFIMMER